MKKLISLIMVLVFCAALWIPVYGKSEKPVTLTFYWWGSQPRHDATLKVIDLYKQKNPNVTIEPQYQSFDGYYQKLAVLAASNSLPDIFQGYVGSSDFQQFLDKNLVECLDGYVRRKLFNASDISTSILSTGKINGKLYGISMGANAKAMIIDPDIYQKAGLPVPKNGYSTWTDLEKDLPKLKAATGAYGADDLLKYDFTLPYYCRQNGQIEYTNKTMIGFTQKTYVNFYSLKTKWIKNGWVPPYDVTVAAKGPEDLQLARGKAAISVIYSSQYAAVAKAAGKALLLIPMPGPNAAKGAEIRAGMHMLMASTSKNKDEAAKFMNFFINDQEANKILNAERGIPIAAKVRAALKPGYTSEQQVMSDFIENLSKKSSPGDPAAPAGATEIDTFLKDMEQKIVFDMITPQEAFKQIQAQANKLIGKK